MLLVILRAGTSGSHQNCGQTGHSAVSVLTFDGLMDSVLM
jgi:hypothetical protein